MAWIKTVWQRVFGLFVDDASFAVCILAALAGVWLGVSVLCLPSIWMAAILFAVLAGILLESTVRRAGR